MRIKRENFKISESDFLIFSVVLAFCQRVLVNESALIPCFKLLLTVCKFTLMTSTRGIESTGRYFS